MSDVSKTEAGWTPEQAQKIAEATEESIRESGQDVGATKRAESSAPREHDITQDAVPEEDRTTKQQEPIELLRQRLETNPANNG